MQSWEDYCDEQDRWLSRRPACVRCGNPIQDDYAYNICDDIRGLYCGDCAAEWLQEQKVDVEEVINGV